MGSGMGPSNVSSCVPISSLLKHMVYLLPFFELFNWLQKKNKIMLNSCPVNRAFHTIGTIDAVNCCFSGRIKCLYSGSNIYWNFSIRPLTFYFSRCLLMSCFRNRPNMTELTKTTSNYTICEISHDQLFLAAKGGGS